MKLAHFLLIIALLLTTACTSKQEELIIELEKFDRQAEKELERLHDHIVHKRVKNAQMLEQYAKVTKIRSPELSEIADALAKDADDKGPIFQSLKTRYQDAKNDLPRVKDQTLEQGTQLLDEYKSILFASSLSNYNLALTDPINVLADLSEGKLPRIEAESKKESLSSNEAKDMGAGSRLVGNPHYGHWQQQSNGTSFWAFYGQYAFLSSLFDRPYSYGYWSRNRDYSYYHDVGRNHYSSRSQMKQQAAVETRAKKNFKSKGQSFQSPYAKKRSSGKTSKSVVSAPSKFKSSNSKYASNYASSNKSKTSNTSKSKSFFSRSSSRSRTFGGGGK